MRRRRRAQSGRRITQPTQGRLQRLQWPPLATAGGRRSCRLQALERYRQLRTGPPRRPHRGLQHSEHRALPVCSRSSLLPPRGLPRHPLRLGHCPFLRLGIPGACASRGPGHRLRLVAVAVALPLRTRCHQARSRPSLYGFRAAGNSVMRKAVTGCTTVQLSMRAGAECCHLPDPSPLESGSGPGHLVPRQCNSREHNGFTARKR